MAPLQGGHNVIGRATIDYELKEAYQPSNVVLDIWFLGSGGSCYREEERTYQITCRQCRGVRSHWGTLGTVLASLRERKTNFGLF